MFGLSKALVSKALVVTAVLVRRCSLGLSRVRGPSAGRSLRARDAFGRREGGEL